MKRGRAGTVAHDYKRHGTITLFAARNAQDGSAISMCPPRHRHGTATANGASSRQMPTSPGCIERCSI